MSIATLNEVIEFDDEGHIDGLQFDGRERAIQEWRDRKEEEEYRQLFDRLQKRNSARRSRSTETGRLRQQENCQRYRKNNRSHVQSLERKRRKARYEADPVVNTCEECGTVWTPPYEQRVKKSRFCSRKCRNRNHGRQRVRSTGLRQMDIQVKVFEFLREHPGSTTRQISEAIGAKRSSLATCISRWAKEGLVVFQGNRKRTYQLPEVTR